MNLTVWHIGMNVNTFVIRNVHKYVYNIIYYIGGRDRVEPEVIVGEYYCYLLYSFLNRDDRRRVLLLFIVSKEGTELNRRWSKGSIMIILLKYAWIYVCDIQYMDVIIYVIRFMNVIIYIIRFMNVIIFIVRYMGVIIYDI